MTRSTRAWIAFVFVLFCFTANPAAPANADGPIKIEVDKVSGPITLGPPDAVPVPEPSPYGPRGTDVDSANGDAEGTWWGRLRHNLASKDYWLGALKGLATTLAIAAAFVALAAVSAPAAVVIGVTLASVGLYRSYRVREAEVAAVGGHQGVWATLGVAALDTLGLSGFYEGVAGRRLLTDTPLSASEAGEAIGTSLGAVVALATGPKAVRALRGTKPVQGIRNGYPQITRWPWQKSSAVGGSPKALSGDGPESSAREVKPGRTPEDLGQNEPPHGVNRQLGDKGLTGSDIATQDPYLVAKNGGKHSAYYELYKGKPGAQIERGIRSLEREVAEHQAKIADPKRFIPEWETLDPRRQQTLLTRKWPGDILRQMEQKRIFEGILEEDGK